VIAGEVEKTTCQTGFYLPQGKHKKYMLDATTASRNSRGSINSHLMTGISIGRLSVVLFRALAIQCS